MEHSAAKGKAFLIFLPLIMDIGQEIDKLFLESGQEKDIDVLQIIKTHIDSLTSYLESLNPFEKELNEHKQLHEFYKLKLETLSGELQEIEKRSISTQTQINNKKKMYDEIKQLLITIEIKPEYFNKVKNPNFHDLTGLRVALNALKSFECDYDIKAVNEKKERISRTLKDFMNEFMIFFQKRINTYETESRGELRIHQHVYDDIRKYSFVFEYCKEFDKNSFITLSRKYLTVSKSLYEKEFERHLKIVCKSLKEYKTKLKEKMNEALNVVVESFYLIVACESNFIGKTFDDNVSFENEYVTNMFNNVTEVIFDFIRDTYRMHSLFCINALCNIREISANQENSNLEIVQKFKIKLEDFLNDFKKDYIRIKTQHWKTQSKRKFYKELIDEIKASSYVEMNVELSQLFLAKINDIHQDKKGKIEFSLYKLNFINDIDALNYKENNSAIEDMNKKESEILEKNIITFVFGKDKDRIEERIKIIRDLITNMYKDNNKRKISVLHTIKNIIDEQADDKVKAYTDKYLKS